MKKVLIACEESQIVTIEMRKLGIEAYSCDILPCSGGHPEWHIQDDVLNHLHHNWDMMIAHPPCTYLSNAGAKWFNENKYGLKAKDRYQKRIKSFNFVMMLVNAPINKIAIENPPGYLNTHFKKPNQIIQPYQFGISNSKRVCLWLKNLPLLTKTCIVDKDELIRRPNGKVTSKQYYNSYKLPIKERSKIRSKTSLGIAKAIAYQWGKLI